MITREIKILLPAYFHLPAAAGRGFIAWPDGIATQWIPDPADCSPPILDLRRAGGHGDAHRQRADRPGCAARGRGDAQQRQHLHVGRRCPGRAGRRGSAPGQTRRCPGRVIAELTRAGPGSRGPDRGRTELDPQLWQRLFEALHQVGMTAVLALRPDDAHGVPPPLGETGDPDEGQPHVAYLKLMTPGSQPTAWFVATLPEAADLAAFPVHTWHHRRPQDRRAHPRQPARLRPGDRAVQRAGSPGRLLAGLPLFHVNALIVTGIALMFSGAQGRAGAGLLLPGQGAVRPVLAAHRALPGRGDVRRPHRLRHPGAGPGQRRHQLAAHPDRRCGPAARIGTRSSSPGAPGAACWRATGSLRRPAPAPGPDPARNAPARSAAPSPDSRSKPSGSARTDPGRTAPPARPAC